MRLIVCCVVALGSVAAVLSEARADVSSPEAELHAAPPNDGLGFFLSWGRPYGEPGARSTRLGSCRDTTTTDTLFLCLRSGVTHPRFVAFSADLYFQASVQESLGTFWHLERGAANEGGMGIRFQRLAEEPESGPDDFLQPWTSIGFGVVGYTRTRSSGRLRMVFAVDTAHAVPIEKDRTYTLARVLLRGRAEGLTGCEQRLGIEWRNGTLAFGPGAEFQLRKGGVRWVTNGSAGARTLSRLLGVKPREASALLTRVDPPSTLDPGP